MKERRKNLGPSIIQTLRKRTKFLTTSEVIEIINVGRNTLCKWVREDKIPAFRYSKGNEFDPHMLADWLEARMI